MIRLLFVCHGNICRSPMAEYVCKYLAKEYFLDSYLYIESRATSNEEIDHDIYYHCKKILEAHNIPYDIHHAKRITKKDFESFDFVIGMDTYNIRNLENMFGKSDKIKKLSEFSDLDIDVLDPWYTREFEECYSEIYAYTKNLIKFLSKRLSL